MRKVFLKISLVVISILSFQAAQAQMESPVALGLRATPDGGGFTGKFFINDNFAIEAQLNGGGIGIGDASLTAVGLAEYHIIMPDPSWRIFFGGGLHFGTWDKHGGEGIFGLDGVGGVAYVFKKIPLELSADFKPAINLVSTLDFFPNNFFGVAGRFFLPIANKHKANKK